MSKRNTILLPTGELLLRAALDEMAAQMIQDCGEESAENPLDFYGEAYMENLSEAGYSETRPNDRLSIRAFAHLLRVNGADLKLLKSTLGFRRGSTYHDFAISDNLLTVLSRNQEVAAALTLLAPDKEGKSVGPFYPDVSEFDACAHLSGRADYAEFLKSIADRKADAAVDAAAIKLAGLFNITGLKRVSSDLQKLSGATGLALSAAVAHAALAALRSEARFTAGLRCVQPSTKSE